MRNTQAGSAGPLVMLAILAALAWWQWDWIAGLFGGAAGGAAAQVVDYRCERGGDGRLLIDGRIRNGSAAPIGLRAVTAIYDATGKRSDYAEANVRPSPLQPGQEGFFRGDAPPLPEGGSCKLDRIVDADNGKTVRHSGAGR